MHTFQFKTLCSSSVDQVFAWHANRASMRRSLPQWLKKAEWHSQIDRSNHMIGYRQENGSFSYRLRLKEVDGGCELFEEVSFRTWPWLKKRRARSLKHAIKYKHEIMRHDLSLKESYGELASLRILVVGGSGLIGSALCQFLESMDHRAMKTVRQKRPLNPDEIYWNDGEGNPSDFEGFDVVVNLAGYSVGKKRWSENVKDLIFSSRVRSTQKLLQILSILKHPPKVFICASAIGIYGEHGTEEVDENSYVEKGNFLSRICQSWEEMSHSIEVKGMRIVNARFGLILSSKGGALQKMGRLFRMGLGSILGSGKQYASWISIDDAVAALYHCMLKDVKGGVNITSPHPMTNDQFSHALARSVGKSLAPRLPHWAILLLFGQMGEELFLTSIRAIPKKLKTTSFRFYYPNLEQAFKHLI